MDEEDGQRCIHFFFLNDFHDTITILGQMIADSRVFFPSPFSCNTSELKTKKQREEQDDANKGRKEAGIFSYLFFFFSFYSDFC